MESSRGAKGYLEVLREMMMGVLFRRHCSAFRDIKEGFQNI